MFCTHCFGHPKDCNCGTLQPIAPIVSVVEVRTQRADTPASSPAMGAKVGTAGTRLDGKEVPWGRVTCQHCQRTFSHAPWCKVIAQQKGSVA